MTDSDNAGEENELGRLVTVLAALAFLEVNWGGTGWLSLSPRRKDGLWVTALAQCLTPEGEEREAICTSSKPDF